MKSLKMAAGAAALVFATPAFAAPLISFNSFEAPSLGTGSGAYRYFLQPGGGFPAVPNGFTPIPGVTFTGASGIQANGSAWGFTPAPNGVQTAFIQSYNGVGGAISIALNGLIAGHTYKVSFAAAQRPGYGVNPFTVGVTGGTLGSFSTASTAWTTYTTSFVAGGATDTLTFRGSAITGDSGFGLDAITVAVPEPATWALLILGFGTLGAALRRRQPRGVSLA